MFLTLFEYKAKHRGYIQLQKHFIIGLGLNMYLLIGTKYNLLKV